MARALDATTTLTGLELLDRYSALLNQSSRMLDMARQGEWPLLVEEESRYMVAMERLTHLTAQNDLESNLEEQRLAVVEQLLEQSLEIQRRLMVRRDELGQMIAASERKREVDRAYLGQGDSTPGHNQFRVDDLPP